MIAVYKESRCSKSGNIICKLSFWGVCQNYNIITEGDMDSVCPNDYNITWDGGSLKTPKNVFVIYVRPHEPSSCSLLLKLW